MWKKSTTTVPGIELRGRKLGPLRLVTFARTTSPRWMDSRVLFLGRASVSYGAAQGIASGYADALEAGPQRARWLRRSFPAVQIAWDGSPGQER